MDRFTHHFHAEAAIDITRLFREVMKFDDEFLILSVQPLAIGVIEVHCQTILTRNNMLARMAQVEDGHVMARTLETTPAAPAPQPEKNFNPA